MQSNINASKFKAHSSFPLTDWNMLIQKYTVWKMMNPADDKSQKIGWLGGGRNIQCDASNSSKGLTIKICKVTDAHFAS